MTDTIGLACATIAVHTAGTDPERFVMMLQRAAWSITEGFNEELSHHLQNELGATDRKRVRDLALLIAGACGEAE